MDIKHIQNTRINRYIMECKLISYKIPPEHLCELIDTLWNVNFLRVLLLRSWSDELIDTLWNVNSIPEGFSFTLLFELIDTLWNVNWLIRAFFQLLFRINRYIMECKFVSSYPIPSMCPELIDTLWNVNLVSALCHSLYWWN